MPNTTFELTVNNNVNNGVIESIVINSKGLVEYNGNVIEETLSLTLTSITAGLFEDAIFANQTLNVSGMREVFGDLSSNEDIIVGGTGRGECPALLTTLLNQNF